MNIYGVVGFKNAGKTGLMERLVSEFTARGYSVSTIKHAHHRFDVDQPGKDSFRHREAGATQTLLASGTRWALMSELRGDIEPPLTELLAKMSPVDLILVEGYKRDDHRKIEAVRGENNHPLIAVDDANVRAIAADCPVSIDRPLFDLNDTNAIADFITADLALAAPA